MRLRLFYSFAATHLTADTSVEVMTGKMKAVWVTEGEGWVTEGEGKGEGEGEGEGVCVCVCV